MDGESSRSVRNPAEAKGPAQRAAELAQGAGAGPAPTGPARSPAAGEMKLSACQANETCAAAERAKPALQPSERKLRRRLANETCTAAERTKPAPPAAALLPLIPFGSDL